MAPVEALISSADPRIYMLVAALPSAASGLWVFTQWYAKRHDDRTAAGLSREEKRQAELNARQATLDAETSRWFGELRAENKELRTMLTEVRRDRDRGWDLARWWHGTAHDVLRAFRNLRHNALNMQQWIQSATRLHPDLGSPTTIEPVPERIDLPMGLEEPKDV